MQIDSSISINKTYDEAVKFAKVHYENFPVVSFLVPKKLRKHIAIIYWFARTADDYADEGNFSEEERIDKLNEFENSLTQLLNGNPDSNFEVALKNTIKERNLSSENFYNLLKAFKQDVHKKRYKDFNELLNYCNHSANPVGRLILELYNIRNDKAFFYSDKICTALQLTNFYQDVKIDLKKDRIYLPQNELKEFGIDEKQLLQNRSNDNLNDFIKFNVERTEGYFNEGKKLLYFLNGRLKYEIKWTILGGEEILKKIKKNNFDVLNNRPVLSKFDYLLLFLKSLKPW